MSKVTYNRSRRAIGHPHLRHSGLPQVTQGPAGVQDPFVLSRTVASFMMNLSGIFSFHPPLWDSHNLSFCHLLSSRASGSDLLASRTAAMTVNGPRGLEDFHCGACFLGGTA